MFLKILEGCETLSTKHRNYQVKGSGADLLDDLSIQLLLLFDNSRKILFAQY